MITKEILLANAPLSALTDEQVAAILALNQNDLDAEISKKFGEVYRQLDASIKSSTGIDRDGDEKTYKYLERAVAKMKSTLGDTSELQSKVDSLAAEKQRLEAALAKSGSEESQRLLSQAKAELENTKAEFNKLQKKMLDKDKEHQKELLDLRVSGEVNQAAANLQFKREIPESAAKVLLDQAKSRVMGMSPDYIDDGNGGKRLVFRGEDGAIKNNPNNQLNPYTTGELLTELLSDVIAPARNLRGAGSQQPPVKGGASGTVDVSSARTRVEANELITKSLMAQGLVAGSDEFQEKMDQAWKDNNVSALPLN